LHCLSRRILFLYFLLFLSLLIQYNTGRKSNGKNLFPNVKWETVNIRIVIIIRNIINIAKGNAVINIRNIEDMKENTVLVLQEPPVPQERVVLQEPPVPQERVVPQDLPVPLVYLVL
jgi:hypothetical protein